MSYRIYSTEGIVIGSKNYGEADKLYKLFTKELGTIFVHARSIRKQESKLSSQIRTYASATFSLVRGKDLWKLTTSELTYIFDDIFKDPVLRKVYARIFLLLERLLKGEDKNEKLYELVLNGILFLEKNPKEWPLIETIIVWRILYELGYADDSNNMILGVEINKEQMDYVGQNRLKIVKQINTSLEATHLV